MLLGIGIVLCTLGLLFSIRWFHHWAYQYLNGVKAKADRDFWLAMCIIPGIICVFLGIV